MIRQNSMNRVAGSTLELVDLNGMGDDSPGFIGNKISRIRVDKISIMFATALRTNERIRRETSRSLKKKR